MRSPATGTRPTTCSRPHSPSCTSRGRGSSGAAPRRRTSAGSSSARPIDERLLAGRRALRRRRIVATGATAAAVAALVLTPLAAGRLHGSPEQLPVTRPSQSPIDLPIAPAARVDQASLPLLFLHGTLYRRDSTVTVERLIRPVDRGRPHTAAALLSIEGVPAWVYAAGSSAGHLSAPEGGTTLADWAQQQLHDTTTIAPGDTYAEQPHHTRTLAGRVRR